MDSIFAANTPFLENPNMAKTARYESTKNALQIGVSPIDFVFFLLYCFCGPENPYFFPIFSEDFSSPPTAQCKTSLLSAALGEYGEL